MTQARGEGLSLLRLGLAQTDPLAVDAFTSQRERLRVTRAMYEYSVYFCTSSTRRCNFEYTSTTVGPAGRRVSQRELRRLQRLQMRGRHCGNQFAQHRPDPVE
jgi:hypothetical protein